VKSHGGTLGRSDITFISRTNFNGGRINLGHKKLFSNVSYSV